MKILNKMLGAAALALAAFMPAAQADVVYQFTNPAFSGSSLPGIPDGQVFATATFVQNGTGLQLTLHMDAAVQFNANADLWVFNIDSAAFPGFAMSNASGVPATFLLPSDPNCCTGDGTGKYDFGVAFPNQNDELASNHTSVINITSSINLTEAMILGQLSTGGHGAAIHVQRLDINGNGSGWFANCIPNEQTHTCESPGNPEGNPTPEPGTLALLGLGLGLLAYRRRMQ